MNDNKLSTALNICFMQECEELAMLEESEYVFSEIFENKINKLLEKFDITNANSA